MLRFHELSASPNSLKVRSALRFNEMPLAASSACAFPTGALVESAPVFGRAREQFALDPERFGPLLSTPGPWFERHA